MTRAPDDGRYIERQVPDTTPGVQVDDEGRLSYSTSTPTVPEVVLRAVRVNAERDHFVSSTGLDGCDLIQRIGPCNCGKAEAEEALAFLAAPDRR